MISADTVRTERVRVLRDAFDSAFSAVPPVAGDPPVDLLAIRVGGAPYALRLSEITALYANKAITALPGTSSDLLGVAGFRGAIVAVYDLRILLGAEATGLCRWLVLASDSRIGLAFDQFEGHLRVLRDAIASEAGSEHAGTNAREAVQVADLLRPIVNVPVLLEAIKESREPTEKER